jgi:hypothetical protein
VNDIDSVLPPAAEDLQEKAEAEEEEERAKEGGAGAEGAKLGRSSEFWRLVMEFVSLICRVVSFLKI